MDPWRTKPLQIADLSWQVQAVFFEFLMYKFDGSWFFYRRYSKCSKAWTITFLSGVWGLGFGVWAISKENSCSVKVAEKKNRARGARHGEK